MTDHSNLTPEQMTAHSGKEIPGLTDRVGLLKANQWLARDRDEAFACLEFLLCEQINGVICAEDNNPCARCAANWKRVRRLLDGPGGE